jgi:hypothetical protein
MVNFCRTQLIDKKLKELLEKSTSLKLKEEIQETERERKSYLSLDFIVSLAKELNMPLNELLEKSSVFVEPVVEIKRDVQAEKRKEAVRRKAGDLQYLQMVKDIEKKDVRGENQNEKKMKNSALKETAEPIAMVLTFVGAFSFVYLMIMWTSKNWLAAMICGVVVAVILVSVEVWLWILRQRKVEHIEMRDDKLNNLLQPFGEQGSGTEQNKKILKNFENMNKKQL